MRILILLVLVSLAFGFTKCITSKCADESSNCGKDNTCISAVVKCSTEHLQNLKAGWDADKCRTAYKLCLAKSSNPKLSKIASCWQRSCPNSYPM